jgi:hypothetical protein
LKYIGGEQESKELIKYENLNPNLNMNLELNNIQKINEEAKENLSKENKDIYNHIHNFFNKEYNSLNQKINDLQKNNYINNQLNSLRESIYLRKYKNIFSNIYEKEQKKFEDISNNIIKSKKNLDNIRRECNSLFNEINSGLDQKEYINGNFRNIMEKINDYDNSNNNKLRKSSSMDNRINNRKKYNNFRYSFNNKNENIKEKEETKEEDDINYISFPLFCNSYDPYYLSEKINNSFSHNFFNFKKNYGEIKFRIMSSKLI